MFIWYNARAVENFKDPDQACRVRSAMETLRKDGVCDETLYPYPSFNQTKEESVAHSTIRPELPAYDCGLRYRVAGYKRLDHKSTKEEKHAFDSMGRDQALAQKNEIGKALLGRLRAAAGGTGAGLGSAGAVIGVRDAGGG